MSVEIANALGDADLILARSLYLTDEAVQSGHSLFGCSAAFKSSKGRT
jgi:hypothetical protein